MNVVYTYCFACGTCVTGGAMDPEAKPVDGEQVFHLCDACADALGASPGA